MTKMINVSVQLLDKNFQIKTPEDHVNTLHAAAKKLNKEMQQLQNAGILDFERIAAISALNHAATALQTDAHSSTTTSELSERIHQLNRRVVECLTKVDQLEL